jgi:hypothetical protein
MYDKIFETALGIEAPWTVKSVQFQQAEVARRQGTAH